MYQKLLFILIVFLITACTENKSVTKELSIRQIAHLVKKDSLYENIIVKAEYVRKKIEDNRILMSKFHKFTFNDYLQFDKIRKSTSFIKEVEKTSSEIYLTVNDSIFHIYKPVIDSMMTSYRNLFIKDDPSKYFKVEFDGILTNHPKLTYKYGINFKITALQGPIQGGRFRYSFVNKITGDYAESGYGKFVMDIKTIAGFAREAPNDFEKYAIKNYQKDISSTTEKILKEYYFENTIEYTQQNDKYISTELNIPSTYYVCFDKDTLKNYDYQKILKEEYYINIKYEEEIYDEVFSEKSKKLNPLAFEFEQYFK